MLCQEFNEQLGFTHDVVNSIWFNTYDAQTATTQVGGPGYYVYPAKSGFLKRNLGRKVEKEHEASGYTNAEIFWESYKSTLEIGGGLIP